MTLRPTTLFCAIFLGVFGPFIMQPVQADGRESWLEDLDPITRAHWRSADADHLLERVGFGARPQEITQLSRLTPKAAVARLVQPKRVHNQPQFQHSGIFDPTLEPFPPSRPAATRQAQATGSALGIDVKPAGNRPIQPIVNRFFYWLRASRLETDRVAYWWANRMLATKHPLQEKVALFWHGHFAVNEDKVRDYRKMLQQIELFQSLGLGNFRTLLIKVAQDPAMLAFLDAGVNVKGSPNENFAREIMELFTMGVGHYSEQDVREAARAFTGWNYVGLDFRLNSAQHDAGQKTILGQQANLDGIDVIDLILEQPATARFVATKLYRYFVREELSPAFSEKLGEELRKLDYDIGRFLQRLFLSKDFYSEASVGTRSKPPVEMVVSTYRRLGLATIPGVPDFNQVTGNLGQHLLHPPTVAGWAQGRSWITPSLLFERGNFVLDVLFPDISFIPPDRYPSYGADIVSVHNRTRDGLEISQATRNSDLVGDIAESNLQADRDEAFNTRYGTYRGWQMAIERVRPILRDTARLQLTEQVLAANCDTPARVVQHFEQQFFSVPLSAADRSQLAQYLMDRLGTSDIYAARSFLEEPLRHFLHLMLSLPEYQLG